MSKQQAHMSIGAPKFSAPEGLKDAGHVLLSCSNCNAILADIWRTRPHEKEVWKLVATCPFCGDKSFSEEIAGGFCPGGYGRMIDEDNDIPSTIIDRIEPEGDTVVLHMLKANALAQPIRQRS